MKKQNDPKSQVWGGRMQSEPSMMNVYYCAGRDPFATPPADDLLIPYDIWVNRVHCLMLLKQNIINKETASEILFAIDKIAELYRKGEFRIEKELEDVHITIESKVAEISGEQAAGQMHTGRSRNDQTTTDCRLYVRDRLLEFYSRVITLVDSLLKTAGKHLRTVMPGFTHYQPAAVTSFGHFLASHAQAMLRDLTRIGMTYEQWNSSPLGAAAAFGTSWNIDRDYASGLLGFSHIQENSLDCISSRWEFEYQAASDLALFMNHLSVLGQDLILFSMAPRPMIKIDDAYVTGSSIMPQKRNPDFAEVTKARAAACHGIVQTLLSLSKGAISGYNRDAQWSKYAILDLFEEVRFAPLIFKGVISTLQVNEKEMAERCRQNFITSVDIADYISQEKGLPFRSVYKMISETVGKCEEEGKLNLDIINKRLMQMGRHNAKLRKSEWVMLNAPGRLLERKKVAGGPAPDSVKTNINRLKQDLKTKKSWHSRKQKELENAHRLMRREIDKILKK